ncbi:Ribonuclease-like 3 [Channa argus]|uniref:Ribonuclease-like 3 n=1 Tax=Channa argus TaxID=215402 RepID=A0A6G1PE74_CHAAH|nr:Ribonuclease-like 3 [Channa argus]
MKILFACVLLMLLSATVLSGSKIQIRVQSSATVFPKNEADESRKLSEEKRYDKFKRQHLIKEWPCDEVIRAREIYSEDNSCKPINTFILADEKRVKDICKGVKNDMVQSEEEFDIVKCRTIQAANPPACKYKVKRLTKTVKVKCENQLPVHYETHSALSE